MYISGSNTYTTAVYSNAAVHPLTNYQPGLVVSNQPMYYASVPQVIVAGGCNHYFVTDRRYSCFAWFWFFFLCMTCPILSFIPFCIDDCTDQVSVCANCGLRV